MIEYADIDKWKHLREGLFRNVEPVAELVAMTQPVGRYIELVTPETLPAFTARRSHESLGTIIDDLRLNEWLIKKGHHTPLEALSFVFDVDGITKSLQNQWVRHRIGIGWTFRSTRFISASQNRFVYNTYHYVEDEDSVKQLLSIDEKTAKRAIAEYDSKIALGATKQDSRKNMPVFWCTPCYAYCNARSLRYLFNLRLAQDAEWEIRRLHKLFYDIVMQQAPSLFKDFQEMATKGYSK